jgi:hypothetical protein
MKRYLTSVEFGDYGKIRDSKGITSDWQFFRKSRNFRKQFEVWFIETLLREPTSNYTFERSDTASSCLLINQDVVFFCSVQRRSEGDLQSTSGSGRIFTERRIVPITLRDFLRAINQSERIYVAIQDALTIVSERGRIHPEPSADVDHPSLTVPEISCDVSLLPDGPQTLDYFVGFYAKPLWELSGSIKGNIICNLVVNIFSNTSNKSNVLVIKDGDELSDSDYLMVMEIVQILHYIAYAEKADVIRFSLDYFSSESFDVIFTHPNDINQLFHFNKKIRMSQQTREFNLEHILSYGNPFTCIYHAFVGGYFTQYSEAKNVWMRNVHHIHSGKWGEFYAECFKGKMTALAWATLLNEAIRQSAMSLAAFNDLLANPDHYATDIDADKKYNFWKLAMNFGWPLARETIEYYHRHVSSNVKETEQFALEHRGAHSYANLQRLLSELK